MSEPDYVVIRPATDLPDGFLPPHWDGRWLDRATLPEVYTRPDAQTSTATAVPTGRFEVRDYDGAVAEVFEVRGAGPVRPDEEQVPHDVDECEWEEGCRCLCPECQGRPDEEPTP